MLTFEIYDGFFVDNHPLHRVALKHQQQQPEQHQQDMMTSNSDDSDGWGWCNNVQLLGNGERMEISSIELEAQGQNASNWTIMLNSSTYPAIYTFLSSLCQRYIFGIHCFE